MLDPRSFRALARIAVIGLIVALVAACGGTASSSAGPPSQTAAAPSVAEPGEQASPDDVTTTETPGGGGTAAGDRTKGSVQVQVTGGITETIDLPFAAVLSLWASSGPGSAYLPFTDGDAVLFMTFNGGQLLIQYAKTSTAVGLTSGATPCTFTSDVLDDSNAKGSFSCKGMTLIQGQAVGSADISGTFEARK